MSDQAPPALPPGPINIAALVGMKQLFAELTGVTDAVPTGLSEPLGMDGFDEEETEEETP